MGMVWYLKGQGSCLPVGCNGGNGAHGPGLKVDGKQRVQDSK